MLSFAKSLLLISRLSNGPNKSSAALVIRRASTLSLSVIDIISSIDKENLVRSKERSNLATSLRHACCFRSLRGSPESIIFLQVFLRVLTLYRYRIQVGVPVIASQALQASLTLV